MTTEVAKLGLKAKPERKTVDMVNLRTEQKQYSPVWPSFLPFILRNQNDVFRNKN